MNSRERERERNRDRAEGFTAIQDKSVTHHVLHDVLNIITHHFSFEVFVLK